MRGISLAKPAGTEKHDSDLYYQRFGGFTLRRSCVLLGDPSQTKRGKLVYLFLQGSLPTHLEEPQIADQLVETSAS